jgi:hypothetical protein
MNDKPTAAFIRDHGRALARLEISERRAGELAAEVERLNCAVLDAAARLEFNDEPARFAAVLRAYRQVEKKR